MKVSWVLPALNEEDEMDYCLWTISRQTCPIEELIIVHGNSTDGTRGIIEKYKTILPIRHIEENKNNGCGPARDIGNSLATGDVIAICDVAAYHLRRNEWINEHWVLHPDDDFIFAWDISRTVNDPLDWKILKRGPNPHGNIRWDGNNKCPAKHPAAAVKRNVADHHSYGDYEIYEKYFHELLKCGHKLGYIDKAVVLWTMGTSHKRRSQAEYVKRRYEWAASVGIRL